MIHQFAFTKDLPNRWIKTWAEGFCAANEGWTYHCHSWFPFLKGEFFGCSMYTGDPWGMDPLKMQLFALEIIFQRGGYHVPLAVTWSKDSSILALPAAGDLAAGATRSIVTPSLSDCFSETAVASGFFEHQGLGIVGGCAGSDKLLQRIKELLSMSEVPVGTKDLSESRIVPVDSQTSYLEFPQWSRFLGAAMIFDLCDNPQTERDAVAWGYDSVVPAYGLPRKHFSALRDVEGRFVAVTDAALYRYRSLLDAVPGFISEMDTQHGENGWHFLCLVLQWKAGSDGPTLVEVRDASPPGDAWFVGFVANAGAGALLPALTDEADYGACYWNLCLSLLKLSTSTVRGEPVKVGLGLRRWVYAQNDPRSQTDS